MSALVIVGAIPLLVRARRAAIDDPRAGRGARRQTDDRAHANDDAGARAAHPAAADLVAGGCRHEPAAQRLPVRLRRISTFDAALPPAVDRLWLRCAVVIASAIGLALLSIGIATYLMAAGHDTFSWAAYVVAGLITLAMPAIPWIYLRQLHELVDS